MDESKLSVNAPFTQRQNTFLQELVNENTTFELRSKKFGQGVNPFPQGAQLNVVKYLNTIGDGTVGGNYNIITKP